MAEEIDGEYSKRAETLLLVDRYIQATERHDAAASELSEAFCNMQTKLSRPTRFVVKISYIHYLVTNDIDGKFAVESIKFL